MTDPAIHHRAEFAKPTIFRTCDEMGEAAVLADLERAGVSFQSSEQKWLAWEWVYTQRINREQATQKALRDTAVKTLWVALGTCAVAVFTACLVLVEVYARH